MSTDISYRESCKCGATLDVRGYVTSARMAYESFRDLHEACRKSPTRTRVTHHAGACR